jgi:hypothetical protein
MAKRDRANTRRSGHRAGGQLHAVDEGKVGKYVEALEGKIDERLWSLHTLQVLDLPIRRCAWFLRFHFDESAVRKRYCRSCEPQSTRNSLVEYAREKMLGATAQEGLLTVKSDDIDAAWDRWTKLANAGASHIVQVSCTHIYVQIPSVLKRLALQQRVHGEKSCWLVSICVVPVIYQYETALESDAWICLHTSEPRRMLDCIAWAKDEPQAADTAIYTYKSEPARHKDTN